MTSFQLALIQEHGYEQPQQALQHYVKNIRQAHAKGAQLILLPELHNSYYFCQTETATNFSLAETIPGASTEILCPLARELNIVIVASLFEKRAVGIYHNTAVVIDRNGEIAGLYRKMHIPEDPGYYEKFYFTPGDLGFQPVETSIAKLGVLVCWDQWFPEGARLMALHGAEILLYPTAIGWVPSDPDLALRQQQRDAWITIQRSHAIANGLFVASCNRYGIEKSAENSDQGIEFWGSSFITGTQGQILCQASHNKTEILLATIDKTQIDLIRHGWPYLRDRRIDAYGDLLKRYGE